MIQLRDSRQANSLLVMSSELICIVKLTGGYVFEKVMSIGDN